MSFVMAQPAAIAAAAAQLLALGVAMEAVNAAAAGVHGAVVPPGGEEISAMITTAHHAHHANYQADQAEGTAIHDATVANLVASGVAYSAAEAVNAVTML